MATLLEFFSFSLPEHGSFLDRGCCFENRLFKKAQFILSSQPCQTEEGSVAKKNFVPVVAAALLLEHHDAVRLAHEVVAQLKLELTFFALDALLLMEQIGVHHVLYVESKKNNARNQYASQKAVPGEVQAALLFKFALNLIIRVLAFCLHNKNG